MRTRSTQAALPGVLGLGLLTAACSGPRPVLDKEALLTSTGFERREADSSKRQAMMERLPPNKLIQQQRKGKAVYIYADPTGCNCVYLGNRDAFERYEHTAHGQEPIYGNADTSWDWEPWGMAGWRE